MATRFPAARFNVLMTAPRLAGEAVAVLEAAALDVVEAEPPAASHALRRHPLVLVTPHVAGVTESSLVNMGVMAAECVAAMLTGGAIPADRVVP